VSGAVEKRRLRVVAVIARINVGGPAVNVLLTAARLDPNLHDTHVVCGRVAPAEGDMGHLAQSLGVQPIVIRQLGPALHPWNDFISLVRLYRLMRRMRPDIVHTHTAKAGFVGRLAARLAGVPVIVHTYHGHVLRGYFGPLKSRIFLGLERRAARWSQCVLALTEGLRRDLAETFHVTTADRIRVVPLGLDLEPFTETARRSGRFRASIGVACDAPLVGIVGRLTAVKDHDLFVRAAAEIARERPAARFVVVGDGELRAVIGRQVEALGLESAFTFTGWRRDMPSIYSDLDITVISSRNEGTPVTAIEALASGCPVVATAVGGVPELLEHGALGRLVASREAAELAAAILAELTHPMDLEPQRRAVAARYGIDAHVRAIADLYRGLWRSAGVEDHGNSQPIEPPRALHRS
jgi:glycosyltransferase involved in cell wall biosynthesis